VDDDERFETGFMFSGYEWYVKRSARPVGPGPNLFSDSEDNVWIDPEGHLHLSITQTGSGWACGEVVAKHSFGYGRYDFHLGGGADAIDPNAVLGLFTWDNEPEYANREIDIEIARWGRPERDNCQYVVQPADVPTNIHRFNLALDGAESTHCFEWRPRRVAFLSVCGDPSFVEDESCRLGAWTYSGRDVPPPGDAHARINLWLMAGRPPMDGQPVEVVIKRFTFTPEADLH
jgi:hypothetical protein